jgi:hypothetical protein
MYNLAFTGILLFCGMAFIDLDQVNKIIFQTICVLYGSLTSCLGFVLPRLLQVKKDIDERKTRQRQRLNIESTHPIVPVTEESSKSNDMTNRYSTTRNPKKGEYTGSPISDIPTRQQLITNTTTSLESSVTVPSMSHQDNGDDDATVENGRIFTAQDMDRKVTETQDYETYLDVISATSLQEVHHAPDPMEPQCNPPESSKSIPSNSDSKVSDEDE